jgi:hypothetical protein
MTVKSKFTDENPNGFLLLLLCRHLVLRLQIALKYLLFPDVDISGVAHSCADLPENDYIKSCPGILTIGT